MMDLIELARIRQEQAGQKYVLPNGENMAMYRDNGLDVMEELADAWAIAGLWEQRLVKAGVETGTIKSELKSLRAGLEWCAGFVVKVRERLPEEFRRDLMPVDRVAHLEDQ